MAQMSEITQHELKRHVQYDPVTGIFTRIRGTTRSCAGDVAGYVNDCGHVRFRVLGKEYLAHRLAWLYMTGEWPKYTIDHIDRNPSNNAFSNLRDIEQGKNNQNKVIAQSNSESGIRGVSLHKKTGLWRARICLDGKSKTLGYFKTPTDAESCYLKHRREIHRFAAV